MDSHSFTDQVLSYNREVNCPVTLVALVVKSHPNQPGDGDLQQHRKDLLGIAEVERSNATAIPRGSLRILDKFQLNCQHRERPLYRSRRPVTP